MESRQRYKIKYVDNLERDWPPGERYMQPFDVGNIVHYGLRARFHGHSDAFVQAAMQAYIRSNELVDNPSKKELSAVYAFGAYQRNDSYMSANRTYDNYEVVACEKRYYVDMGEILGDNVTLTFEPDLLLKDKFGLYHAIDWKCVASYDMLAAGIESNRQGYTYCLGLKKALGVDITSFTLHQIHRKPPVKPTTPFEPVKRTTKFMDPNDLARFEGYLRAQLRDMVRYHQEIESGDVFTAYPYPKWTCASMCSERDICCNILAKGEQEVADIISTNYRKREQEF
jgi:hypothetical protein